MSAVPRALGMALVAALAPAVVAAHDVGRDARGRSLACDPAAVARVAEPLAAEVRAWETVPGVVRSDGAGTFRILVTVAEAVGNVFLRDRSSCVLPLEQPADVLRDDGLGGDAVAGDLVYTSVPLRLAPDCPLPPTWGDDPASPAGLAVVEVGSLEVDDDDGRRGEFLARPEIGVLDVAVPAVPATALAPDVVVTPHLVNVATTLRATQQFLRAPSDTLASVSRALYAVLPDAFDFLVFFSTNKLELTPDTAPRNFVSGSHRIVRVDATGTGLSPLDASASWGSAGRLLGLDVLDAYNRGLLSKIVTHETLHQWADYLSSALGVSAPDGIHFDPRSSAGSLIGGFRWIDGGDGTFVLDCTEGTSGAHRAAPIDRYLMGLVGPDAVEPLRTYASTSPSPVARCGAVIADVVRTTTIDDIVALHGPRTPGPEASQRAFALAFVAESHARLLDANELAFYDALAAHYTAPVPAEAPDPYHGSAEWAPVTRFFAPGVAWRSDVLVCGNGRLEGPEECDDGNRLAGDGCDADCRRETSPLPLGADAVQRGRANPRRPGRLRVGLLRRPAFDPALVAIDSVRLGGAGAPVVKTRTADVDDDGSQDLVLFFVANATGIVCGDTSAPLAGRMASGEPFAATVSLRLAGCGTRHRTRRVR
jgi:cysteine-rich repeat protein